MLTLDTRPQDREWQALKRWMDLRGEIQWLRRELYRLLCAPLAEGVRLRLQLKLEAEEQARWWMLAWSQAEARR